MKITNNSIANASLPPNKPVADAVGPAVAAEAPAKQKSGSGYYPSPESIRYRQLVGQQPEIRDQRVQEASDRLNRGFYDTPESIAKTADAILAAKE